jgi:hypothetical protein
MGTIPNAELFLWETAREPHFTNLQTMTAIH